MDWAAGGAKSLVAEIGHATGVLSRQVVDEALLGVPAVSYAGEQEHKGTLWYSPSYIHGKAPPEQNVGPKYVPGFEPSAQKLSPLDLFGPPYIHMLDEDPYPW